VAPGWTAEEVQSLTDAKLVVRGAVPEMKID
jgi:acyl CoA:acetate/3-ketoacid CoA transferase beta subunit